MTTIFQTLEDKNNDNDVELHGPYLCRKPNLNKSIYAKNNNNIKEPWLGLGYYFWDTIIEDAEWWGESKYKSINKEYIICKTQYDSKSELLYDLFGNVEHQKDFKNCVIDLVDPYGDDISVPFILEVLKKRATFKYKAIRACPKSLHSNSTTNYIFPGNKFCLPITEKVQICFIDKTLLVNDFIIVKHSYESTYI